MIFWLGVSVIILLMWCCMLLYRIYDLLLARFHMDLE